MTTKVQKSKGKGRRDPERTRASILEAASEHFAANGFSGARVDKIAETAGINKRMLYYYFESKDALFQSVMEDVFLQVSQLPNQLDVENAAPPESARRFVRVIWKFFRDNPKAIALINSENLHKGRHVLQSQKIPQLRASFVTVVKRLIERGQESGEFVGDVDPVDLYITVCSMCYYFRSNRYTLTAGFGRNFLDEAEQERWCGHVERVALAVLQGKA